MNIENLEERLALLERELRDARARVTSPFMTRQEAAEFLRVSVELIDDRLAKGIIPKYRFGGKTLIRKDDLVSAVKLQVGPTAVAA